VLGLDHYAPFLLSAFGITLVVLVGYAMYLRSRLGGARRRAAAMSASDEDYSARNVTAAAPSAATAQAASSANGPSSA
jgi:hypothetical protein